MNLAQRFSVLWGVCISEWRSEFACCIHVCGSNLHGFNMFKCWLWTSLLSLFFSLIRTHWFVDLLMLKLLLHMNWYSINQYQVPIDKEDSNREAREIKEESHLKKDTNEKTDLEGIGPSENVLQVKVTSKTTPHPVGNRFLLSIVNKCKQSLQARSRGSVITVLWPLFFSICAGLLSYAWLGCLFYHANRFQLCHPWLAVAWKLAK